MLCETYLVSTNKKKDFQNLESRDLTSLTLVDSFYPSKYETLLGRLLKLRPKSKKKKKKKS